MASASTRPNVIVFFTDQQRWDTSGLFGNPLDLTPNFDRIATHGTHLVNLFTPQPVCTPARAVMQTGLYATQTGCFRNGIPLSGAQTTLAHLFHAGGYHTAYIGKWHLATGDAPVPLALRGGYGTWLADNAIEFSTEPYSTVLHNENDQPVFLPGYRVDALADAAIRFFHQHLQQRAHMPFYLFLSFLEPHHQNHLDDFPPPDGYRERYAGRWMPPDLAALGGSAAAHLPGYFGTVKRLDEALGRLLDALKSLRVLENTIVLYTADHGCHFKTRNSEYKRSPHDSSIRVPGALYGSVFTGGRRIDALTSLVDLPPTLLDAAGLPIPAHMVGRSLLPFVMGAAERERNRAQANEWGHDVFVQISESGVGRALRTRRWKYAVLAPERNGLQHSSADTYVESHLYDLEADPYELNNLVGATEFRAIADGLAERLIARMAEAGEAPPIILSATTREFDQRHP